MPYFLRFAECVLLSCVIGAVIWILTLAVPSASISQFSGKTFWEVVSAIGTVAAVVVALGIALWQEALRRSEARLRARLTATTLVGPLGRNIDRLQRASRAIQEAEVVYKDAVSHTLRDVMDLVQARNQAVTEGGQIAFELLLEIEEISLEQLAVVSALDARHAEQIAQSAAESRYTYALLNPSSYHAVTEAGRASIANQLRTAEALLKPAWVAFQQIAFRAPNQT
ncbi:hypothetical protein [Cupriavidus alkaliphilus]|uniref:hypothetical protein n=1 Tax=Cupriavidus alkaliphilus TaxID=942866 RepID=UPI001607EE2B|nr:hypothetical protein [Cupriavidus alkaliphilus]MBB3012038.1 low affinity Fe/Cu permease [Cupriavidus alkaliphilus]